MPKNSPIDCRLSCGVASLSSTMKRKSRKNSAISIPCWWSGCLSQVAVLATAVEAMAYSCILSQLELLKARFAASRRARCILLHPIVAFWDVTPHHPPVSLRAPILSLSSTLQPWSLQPTAAWFQRLSNTPTVSLMSIIARVDKRESGHNRSPATMLMAADGDQKGTVL